ncbi:MAG: hypothetical protein AB8B91_07380 [Rubripirellula sp.]
MSPKHKLITTVWCSITMVITMVVSHGHLIMKEIMTHWPTEDTWEGRFETALYTQGGLVFAGSMIIGVAVLIRGYFAKAKDESLARRDLAQREKQERAAERRHEALLESLAAAAGGASSKKSQPSGVRPR